jgi:hypothetical protein
VAGGNMATKDNGGFVVRSTPVQARVLADMLNGHFMTEVGVSFHE